MPHLRPSPRPSQKVQQDGITPPQPQPKKNKKRQQYRTVPTPTVNTAGQQFPSRNVMDAQFARNLGTEAENKNAQEPKQASRKKASEAKAPKVMLKLRNGKANSVQDAEEPRKQTIRLRGMRGGKQVAEQKNDDTEDGGEDNLERDPTSALLLLSCVIETDKEVLEAARILVGMWGDQR
jgi:hypothetical protein